MSYVRCSGVRKGHFTVRPGHGFREGYSGGGEVWALGIIFVLLLPSPELTHSPVHLFWDHWSDLFDLVASLKNNLCFPVSSRVKSELSTTL